MGTVQVYTIDVVCTCVLYRCTVDIVCTCVLSGGQGVFRQGTDSRSYRGRISIPSWKVKWKIHIKY